MAVTLKHRSKKAGLPPGSLIHVGQIIDPKIHISLVDYDPHHLVEMKDISIDQCLRYMQKPTVTWINIRGIHDSNVLNTIGKHFGLHSLLLEDVMNSGQRSKLDYYKDHIYIVMRSLSYDSTADLISDEQVSIVFGKNFLITFLEDSAEVIEPVLARIRNGNQRIRSMGTDYLCYAIMDSIVDHYFVILEVVDRQIEELEEALMHDPGANTMHRIQHLKRGIILLRKSIWPTREVVNNFRRLDTPLITETTKVYMHDVYDHTIQAIDTIESFRDISSGLLDVYLSNISQRMNEVMKVLTVVATIFVPLTFIASIYGMNFEYMPEIHSKWGYPFALSLMLIVGGVMLVFFKRKKWI